MIIQLVTIYLLSVANTTFIRYVERCPTREERRFLQQHPKCSTGERYHCTKDDEFDLVESCNQYIQLPRGYYPRYTSFTDRIFYDPCPKGKYQPWPVKSYEIAECELDKSLCNGIGQISCDVGSTTSDATCACDYSKGFVISGTSRCCSPSGTEDCFCQYRPCQNITQELNSDYHCVDKCSPGYERLPGQNDCTPIPRTTDSMTNVTMVTISTVKSTQDAGIIQGYNKIGMLVTIGVGFAVCVIAVLVIKLVGGVWRPFKFQLIPFCILCFLLIVSFITMIVFVDMDMFAFRGRIHVSILILIIVLSLQDLLTSTTCSYTLLSPMSLTFRASRNNTMSATFSCNRGTLYVVYIMFTHDIAQERITFTEEYDLQVFKLLQAASKGDMRKLRSLQNQRYIDLYETDYDNRSALHLAACEGHKDAVKYLLEHGAYPIAKDRCMKHTAAEDVKWHKDHTMDTAKKDDFGQIIDLLSSYTQKGVSKQKEHFRDMIAVKLINAAKNGDVVELGRLHDLHTDMNLSDADGKTALHAAVENGQLNVVTFLLTECKVSPFVRFRGQTPVKLIKDDEGHSIFKKLTEYEAESKMASLKPPEQSEQPPKELQILRLLNYASRGDIQRLRGLKEARYDMALVDYDKRSALHVAVSDGQEQIVDFLLGECDLGSQPENKEDRWGQTPLNSAKERGKGHIFRVFLKHCPNVVDTESEEYKTFSLLMAGYKGDKETLKRLFKNGIDMNMQDYDGRTALHLAAAENKREVIEYLITTCNCKKDITDRNGSVAGDEIKDENLKDSFPKMMFKPRASVKRADYLSKKDAEIKERKKVTKASTFNVLSHRKEPKTSKEPLPEKTASPLKPAQITDRSNMYAMYEAAATGDIEMLEACEYPYFERGDYIKNTPLHIAAINGHLDIVKYLVEECHVSLFIRNKAMETALDSVIAYLGLLTDRPATFFNVEQRKMLSDIRNYLVKRMKAAENLKDKIKKDSSFLKYDGDVKTFMLLSKAFKGDIRAIRGYIQTDRDIINKSDYDKRTALHIVVAEKHTHLVKYFLESDELKGIIKPNEKDRWGKTPKDEADENGFKELVDLFKSWNKTD